MLKQYLAGNAIDTSELNNEQLLQTLLELCGDNRTVRCIDNNKKHVRFFISTTNTLCYQTGRMKSRGWVYDNQTLSSIRKIVPQKPKADAKKQQRRLVNKLRDEVLKHTSFTNQYIECVKNASTERSMYENKLSSGNRIEGKFISLKSIAKHLRIDVSELEAHIKNQTNWESHRFPMNGLEATVQFVKNDKGFHGYLNLEYKGCLNGYYYLLISDRYFCGYDID